MHKEVTRYALKAQNVLVGTNALSGITRVVKSTGAITKFMIIKSQRQLLGEEVYQDRLTQATEALAEAKLKCNKCRGYDDDAIKCVQRDCKYLFRLAKCARDIEDLQS